MYMYIMKLFEKGLRNLKQKLGIYSRNIGMGFYLENVSFWKWEDR